MTTSTRVPASEDALVRRAAHLASLRQSESGSGDQREMSARSSAVSQHPADTADVSYQRELQQTTQHLLEREARQVEDALRARASGKYGVCDRCGLPIPPERLQARPEATQCVECRRRSESARA